MKNVLFSLVAMLLLSLSGFAQTTYTKVTSSSGLEAGANYLIVAHHDDLGVLAMGYQKSNNRNAVVVSENGESITVTPGTDPASETDVFQFTLGGSNGAWTLYDAAKEGYLYAASSNSNHLKTQTTLDANGEWNITFNGDGTAEVVAQGENTRNNMRFNPNASNNAPLFSCYAETSNIDTRVSFYKAGGTPAQPDPEPSNYPINFAALVDGTDITLTWTDATGSQLPSKYLVLASTGTISVPTDGTPVDDGDLAKNVAYGTQVIEFAGLQSGTAYHFAIFPYTNSGANIDYKTDGTYPTANATTEEVNYLLNENFDDELGVFTAYDAYGDQGWHQGEYNGTTYANMNGYANGAAHQNEDWLIAEIPGMVDTEFTDIFLEFSTAMKFDGDPLRVVVSGDYDGQGEPGDFDWIDITDAFDFSAGNYEWVESGKVNIIDIVGDFANSGYSWYIAFVYTSNDEQASSWEIDFVKLTGKWLASVNENGTMAVSLYPNPANDQVSFTLESDAQVSVFDMTGRKVNEVNLTAGEAQLNVSEFQSGVYFVNIRYANGTTAVSKFVKF
ncbi:MAG: T9SS type A sorting domain-containing protein [Bacteroidales bacterium]|nr:T9SS type A sorting domain-containing protein [Bacteroidales bacterium]